MPVLTDEEFAAPAAMTDEEFAAPASSNIPLPPPDKAKHTLDVAAQRGVSLGDSLEYVGRGGEYEPGPIVPITADTHLPSSAFQLGTDGFTRSLPPDRQIGAIEQLGRIDFKKKLPFVGSMFSIGEFAQRNDDLAMLRIWAKKREDNLQGRGAKWTKQN